MYFLDFAWCLTFTDLEAKVLKIKSAKCLEKFCFSQYNTFSANSYFHTVYKTFSKVSPPLPPPPTFRLIDSPTFLRFMGSLQENGTSKNVVLLFIKQFKQQKLRWMDWISKCYKFIFQIKLGSRELVYIYV